MAAVAPVPACKADMLKLPVPVVLRGEGGPTVKAPSSGGAVKLVSVSASAAIIAKGSNTAAAAAAAAVVPSSSAAAASSTWLG